MFKLLSNNPWGDPWQNGGDNKEKPQNSKPENKAPNNTGQNQDELTKVINDFKKAFKDMFGGGGNKGSGNNNGEFKTPKSLIGLVILSLIGLWLLSGFYKVDADENAAVLYFGKFYKIGTPGLNYHIPYPFGKAIIRSVVNVNTEEFGFSTSNKGRNFDAESLMLTGDENIVDIEFQVQWQISDIKDFVFNVSDTRETIRKSAESVMREVIARTEIAKALSDGKKEIEQESKKLLQEVLDYYGAGVRVALVQLRRVDPPAQVRDAFLDVQAAKADKEKEINQAQSYSNDVIPRARGESAVITQKAEAYYQEVVNKAEGEAARFLSVYGQYALAKTVTKKRIYLETMEEIYKKADKVFIDKSAGKSGIVPYFPLSDIKGNKGEK